MIGSTAFGPIVSGVDGTAETHRLLGGAGACRWKQLINGMHLTGEWNCVEYVVMPPGASCGAHTHTRTEEIYYILAGGAVMEANGTRLRLRPGDLVTAPIGTTHGTVNDTETDMEFFVIEVFPNPDGGNGSTKGSDNAPVKTSLTDRLNGEIGFRGLDQPVRHASVELGSLFTGPWRSFSLIELPPDGKLGAYDIDDADEVLFVQAGDASITFGGESTKGGYGLCVGLPAAVPRTIVNRSAREPLVLVSALADDR